MIFLPKGIKNGEVIDPDKMSEDYIEANRIASETTQYQWRKDEFADAIDKFDESLCKVHYASTVANLKATRLSEPILIDTTHSITNGSGGTAATPGEDADLFLVPLDKGFHSIPNSSITWSSKHPEMVHITFSFQYVRDFIENYSHKDADFAPESGDAYYSKYYKIRLQTGIRVDGAIITGSGPGGLNLQETSRGIGYAARSLVTSVNIVQFLPAGVHTIEAVAATLPITAVQNDGSNSNYTRQVDADATEAETPGYSGKSWWQDICIGTRNLIVVRYGRGKMLRS